MAVESAALIKTLNKTCLDALQAAAGLCVSRTNYNVELEHWLFKLAEAPNADLVRIFKHFDISTAYLTRDLTKAIDGLKTGNAAHAFAGPEHRSGGAGSVGAHLAPVSGHEGAVGALLLAVLSDERLSRQMKEASGQFAKIGVQALQSNFLSIVSGSGEDEAPGTSAAAFVSSVGTSAPGKPGAPSKTPALDQYTVNLTEKAKEGEIDPVIGRDAEVRQMVDILIRRRQNNPILTGEAGVGKTAVVEGFARRIALGDVPPPLKDVALRTLDMGLLAGGSGDERGVREPAQAGDRRGEGVAGADHPLHRRGAHHDRGRRPGRSERRGQPLEAAPSPAATSARSPRPPGRSTRSISRRTPRSLGGSRSSRSRSRARTERS